jgi:hypothetical protein
LGSHKLMTVAYGHTKWLIVEAGRVGGAYPLRHTPPTSLSELAPVVDFNFRFSFGACYTFKLNVLCMDLPSAQIIACSLVALASTTKGLCASGLCPACSPHERAVQAATEHRLIVRANGCGLSDRWHASQQLTGMHNQGSANSGGGAQPGHCSVARVAL